MDAIDNNFYPLQSFGYPRKLVENRLGRMTTLHLLGLEFRPSMKPAARYRTFVPGAAKISNDEDFLMRAMMQPFGLASLMSCRSLRYV